MDELFSKWDPKRRTWMKRLFVDGARHYSIMDTDELLKYVMQQIDLHSKSRDGLSAAEELQDIISSMKEQYYLFTLYAEGIIMRETYFTGPLGSVEVDSKKPSHRATLAIMNYILTELPNLPHHKPTTKVYKACFKLFIDLLEGRFVTKRRSLKRFIEERRLSEELLTKRIFKIGEIKEALQILDTKRAKGKFQTKSMQDLLFDNGGRFGTSSQFLVAWNEFNKRNV